MNAKSLVLLCAASAAGVACAVDYVWTGAASTAAGWTEPSNWNPSTGYPGAGDKATFASSTEIADGFTIGEGVLAIEVAQGAELSLKGAIGGPGGISKTGAGAISLYGDNSFRGGFAAGDRTGGETTVTYHGYSLAANVDGGLVGVWHGNGLGTGTATVNATLYVAGGTEVTVPVVKGWSAGPLVIRGDGDVVFAETFTATDTLPVNGSGTENTLRFKKRFVASGASTVWVSHSGGNGISVSFEDDVLGKPGITLSNGTVDFHGTVNEFYTIEIHGKIRFHKANSFDTPSIAFKKTNGFIDLCGCDQTLTNCVILQESGISGYGVCSDSPAQLRLTQGSKVGWNSSDTFKGVFTGFAGLHFEHNGYSFVFDGVEQTTSGTFSVAGTSWIELVNGATFTSLGKLELLSSNGGIDVSDAGSGDITVNEFTCETIWTKIKAGGEGGKIFCRVFSVAGSAKADGTYSKENSAQAVSDAAGGVVVDSGMPNRYVGAAGGDWSSPDGWWFGSVPAEGESVVLDGVTLNLAAPTPVLGNVTMTDAVLTMSGWDTSLNAADVVLGSGTLVTTPEAFTSDDAKSRVYISCANLTVAEGASIDVSRKGWSCGQPAPSGKANGYGPGAGTLSYGAAHGGPGGKNPDGSEGGSCPSTYGDAAMPVEPGSGGYQDLGSTSSQNTGTHGGGAVRIVAEGTVTVDGTIRANGGSVLSAGTSNLADRRDTAGSGGSVWITCARLAGNGGAIEANGGDGSEPCMPKWVWGTKNLAKPAGGGRIAIEHGSAQSAGDLVGMTISARAGLYTGTSGYFTGSKDNAGTALPLAEQSKFRNNAELGSLWFSDARILDAMLGSGLSGHVVHPVGYSSAGNVSFTDGWVRFGGEGVSVSIGGDLEISSDSARLEIGGVCYTSCVQAVSRTGVSPGRSMVSLDVAGSVSVLDGARLDVRSAETDQTSAFGASVTVGGDFTIGADSTVAPWSDLFTGGSASFKIGGGLVVAEGGALCADGFGFAASCVSGESGYGPGGGRNAAAGSHGGSGGIGYNNGAGMAATVGTAYGDRMRPTAAGSGSGCYGYGIGGNGGGVVHVQVKGDMTVDGVISADGASGTGADETWNVHYSAWQPAGAGGSVYLYGKSLSGNGDIRANGGAGRLLILDKDGFAGVQAVGRGGGGRVAVWTGATVGERLKVRETASAAALEGGFSGSCRAVAGGVSFRYDASDEVRQTESPVCAAGEDGSVCFCVVRKPVGAIVSFR